MTEERKPKLGETANDPLVAAFGGYATAVDLLPGEVALRAWEAGFVNGLAGAWGILYLTTHRLVWIRMKIAPPWAAKTMEIPINDITAAEARKPWGWWLNPFARGRVAIIRKDAEMCQFGASVLGPSAKEITREITSILRDRGLPRD